MKAAYIPAARFEVKVSETECRHTPEGRMLMARIYQALGAGPFPTLLDLHGGGWNRKDRFANEPMDCAVAAIASWKYSAAAITSGPPNRGRKPTAPTQWSRRS